jgi:preprotein translocase subunit SecE
MAESTKGRKKISGFSRISKFVREVKNETKKVVWPNRKQIINNTGIVIIAIMVVGSVIWVLDLAFATGLGAILTNL